MFRSAEAQRVLFEIPEGPLGENQFAEVAAAVSITVRRALVGASILFHFVLACIILINGLVQMRILLDSGHLLLPVNSFAVYVVLEIKDLF